MRVHRGSTLNRVKGWICPQTVSRNDKLEKGAQDKEKRPLDRTELVQTLETQLDTLGDCILHESMIPPGANCSYCVASAL